MIIPIGAYMAAITNSQRIARQRKERQKQEEKERGIKEEKSKNENKD